MATPRVSEHPTTQRHYLTQLAVSAAVIQALREMWAALNPTSSPAAMESFRDGVFALVEQFSQAAASLSADYYAAARTEAGITTTPPRLRLVDAPPRSLTDAGIDWATRADAFVADYEAKVLARVEAAMEKAVLDVGREQIIAAIQGDEKALGFRRAARPGACAWCLTLTMRRSTRGTDGNQHLGVFKSRESAGQLPPNTTGEVNRFHNHCRCAVEPVFSIGDAGLPDWLADMQRLYEESTAGSRKGQRLNDFRRALAAIRRGDEPDINLPDLPPVTPNEDRLDKLGDLLDGFAALDRPA